MAILVIIKYVTKENKKKADEKQEISLFSIFSLDNACIDVV
jgi:hypothetical protein